MAKRTKAELVDAAVAKGIPVDDTWSWRQIKDALDAHEQVSAAEPEDEPEGVDAAPGAEPAEPEQSAFDPVSTAPAGIVVTEAITITTNEDLVPTRNVTSKRLPRVIRLPRRGHIHL